MLDLLRAGAAALVIGVCTAEASSAATETRLPQGVDAGTGFRMERYRAPVPDFIPGGQVVTTGGVHRMAGDRRTILIDVYPPKGAGPDPLDGTWRSSEPHDNIPGSFWLPDVGRGHLEPALESYFRRNLDRLSGGDRTRPLVFYCTADCWQSWNAARRAILWGHANVFWFPEGTDGWAEAGGRLVPAEPVNFLDRD